MLETIEQIKASGANPALELEGIIMTMFDSRTNLSQQVIDEVRKHFGDKVYQTPIPRSVRLSEAPSHGLPIIHYDRNNAGGLAYEAICEEFIQRQGGQIRFVNEAQPQGDVVLTPPDSIQARNLPPVQPT